MIFINYIPFLAVVPILIPARWEEDLRKLDIPTTEAFFKLLGTQGDCFCLPCLTVLSCVYNKNYGTSCYT